jgi:hypothetical protein
MEANLKKILQVSLLVAIPVAVFAAALAFFNLLHAPYATWLQVEAPAYAVAGSTLDVRITLGQVPEPTLLNVDIYLLDRGHGQIGAHPLVIRSPSVQSGGTYSFSAEITDVEKLALLQLVIYLSPDRDWRAATHVARSEDIPVRIHGDRAGGPALRKIRTFVTRGSRNRHFPFNLGMGPSTRTLESQSDVFRIFLLCLLAAGGLVCLIRSARSRPGGDPRNGFERLFWRCAAILLFLGFVWELFHLEVRLSDWGRNVVSGMGLYYFRRSYQEEALALLAAGVAVILLLAFGAVARNRVLLYPVLAGIALTGYVSLSLAASLSFHYFDSLERITLDGVSFVELAKAACAAAVLAVALFAPRSRER